MTRESDFLGLIEDYLDEHEGNTPLPEATRDDIRARISSTSQRPAWWPGWRFPDMNNIAKLGLATAGAIVVALLGYTYFVSPNVGAPDLSDPSPTPTPPELSSTTGEPGTYLLNTEGEPAGEYHLPGDATLTIPAGWSGGSGYRVSKNEDPADPIAYTGVGFWIWDDDFDTVYLDPCEWADGAIEPPVGPTVDDLANALANQPQRGDPVPVDVTLDGYSGKMVEMTVPTDIDFADCDGGEFRSWLGRYHQGPGQVDQLYILDVEGQRVVIYSNYMPGTSEAERAEREAIIDSIQLGGP